MWPDELSGFACLSHSSFGNFMARKHDHEEKRLQVGQYDIKSRKARLKLLDASVTRPANAFPLSPPR